MNTDLNVVPFIDLLTALILFLMITAAWTFVQGLRAEAPGPTAEADPEPTPMLGLEVYADRIVVGRGEGPCEPTATPWRCEVAAWSDVDQALQTDRQAFPHQDTIAIATADGVPFGRTAEALDHTDAYEHRVIAGTQP